MSYLGLLVIIVLIFLCLYVIVDRVCKCLEQCCITKTFGKYAKMDMENNEKANKFD